MGVRAEKKTRGTHAEDRKDGGGGELYGSSLGRMKKTIHGPSRRN